MKRLRRRERVVDVGRKSPDTLTDEESHALALLFQHAPRLREAVDLAMS